MTATGRCLLACGAAAALLAGRAGVALAQTAVPELAIRVSHRAGLPARAAALLVSGQQGGPIAASALAVPLAVGGDRVRFGVVIDVDGSSLLAGRSSGTLEVDVAAYLLTAGGSVTASLSTGFVLDLDHGAEAIGSGGIKLLAVVAAPLGSNRLRALVYVPEGPSFGVLEVPVGPTSVAPGDAFVAPPLFADPPGAWLLAAEEAAPQAPFPFTIASEAIVPATRPVLAPAAEQQARLITRGLAGLAGVSAAVVASDGTDIAPVGVRVIEQATGEGVEVARIALAVPSLPPGAYRLRISAPAGASGVAPAGTVPIVIAPPAPGPQQLAWTSFVGARGSAAAPPQEALAPRGNVKLLPTATLKAAYLAALDRLATAGREGTIAAISEMETAAIATGSTRESKRLLEAETEATRDLMAVEPPAALALLALHLDLHRRYGQTSRFTLQSQTARRIEELASAVAIRGGGANSRVVAAAALSCFAGERHWVGDLVIAARMYRKVLFLDPANPTALAGLGAVLEAAGLFKQALPTLELLVEKQPENPEARLRLAVNLARAGAEQRSADLLASCATPENPAWIRAIASQEMARRLIDAARWDDAAALLAQALAALPDDQGLNVQYAYALDRSGHVFEARAAARRLAKGSPAESPRYRYARPPISEATRECEQLAGLWPEAEAALVRALAAVARSRS